MLKQCSFPGYIQYLKNLIRVKESKVKKSKRTWLLALSCTDLKSKLVWITLKLTHANVSKVVLDEKRCALINVLLTGV